MFKKKTLWVWVVLILLAAWGIIFGVQQFNQHNESNEDTPKKKMTYVVKPASDFEVTGEVAANQEAALDKVRDDQLLVADGQWVNKNQKLDTTGQLAPIAGNFAKGDEQNMIYAPPYKLKADVSEYDLNKIDQGQTVYVKPLADNKAQKQEAQITAIQSSSAKSVSGIAYYNFEASLPEGFRLGQHVMVYIPSKWVKIPKKVVHNKQVKLADGKTKKLSKEEIEQSDPKNYFVSRDYLQPDTKLVYEGK